MTFRTLLIEGSIFAVLVSVFSVFYFGMTSIGTDRPVNLHQDQPTVERQVSVVSKIDIGDGGTVTVLSVPDPVLASSPLLDNRCLIYVNKESQKAVMACLPSGPSSE